MLNRFLTLYLLASVVLAPLVRADYVLYDGDREFTISSSRTFKFRVRVSGGGGQIDALEIVGTPRHETWVSAEMDGLIAADLSYQITNEEMVLELAVENQLLDEHGEVVTLNGVPVKPLTDTGMSVWWNYGMPAGSRSPYRPRIIASLVSIPSSSTQTQFSYGADMLKLPFFKSIPVLNHIGLQIFHNHSITYDPSKAMDIKAMTPAIDVVQMLRGMQTDLALHPNASTQLKNKLRALETLNTDPADKSNMNIIEYLMAHTPMIFKVASGFDTVASVEQVRYFSPFVQGAKLNQQKLMQFAGDAAAVAADEVMRTFLCKFPPAVLDEFMALNTGESETSQRGFIEKYRYSCDELRIAFRTETYPYRPTTISATEMAQLISVSAGNLLSIRNEAKTVFSFFAEASKHLIEPYRGSPYFVDMENFDVNNKERKETILFLTELSRRSGQCPPESQAEGICSAPAKTVAEIGLKDSGALGDKAECWASGSCLSRATLAKVLKNYFSLFSGTGEPNLGFSGKDLIRAELAHQLRPNFRATFPYHFTKKTIDNYKSLDDANQWCLQHGLALLGEEYRGYRQIKELSEKWDREVNSTLINIPRTWDTYRFYKIAHSAYREKYQLKRCSTDVWTEYPFESNVRWSEAPLSEGNHGNTLVFRKYPTYRATVDLDELRIPGSLSLIKYTAGTICVGGTRAYDGTPATRPRRNNVCPFVLKGVCYEDDPNIP